jgi:CHAT domain-containing protein
MHCRKRSLIPKAVITCINQDKFGTQTRNLQPALRSIRLETPSTRYGAIQFGNAATLWLFIRASQYFQCGQPIDFQQVKTALRKLNESVHSFNIEGFELDKGGSLAANRKVATFYELVPKIESDGTLILSTQPKVFKEIQLFTNCNWKEDTFTTRGAIPLRGKQYESEIRQAFGFKAGDRWPADGNALGLTYNRVYAAAPYKGVALAIAVEEDPDRVTGILCLLPSEPADVAVFEAKQIDPRQSVAAAKQQISLYQDALSLLRQQPTKRPEEWLPNAPNKFQFRVFQFQGSSGIFSQASEDEMLVGIAAAYLVMGESYQALHYLTQANQHHSDRGITMAIGEIYQTLGDPEQSRRYYQQALSSTLETKGTGAIFRDVFDALNVAQDRAVGAALLKVSQQLNLSGNLVAQAQVTPSQSTPSTPPSGRQLNQDDQDGNAAFNFAALAEFSKSQGDFAKAAYWTRQDAAEYYNDKNWQQAINRLQDALELSRKAKEPIGEAETLTYLAIIHNRFATESNQPKARQTALDYYYQALTQWQKTNYRPKQEQDIARFGTGFSSEAADELTQIARLYDNLGQPQQALDYTIQALLTGAQAPPRLEETERLLFMGFIYNKLKQPQQALEVFGKALGIQQAKENKWAQAETLLFMGMVSYLSLDQPQQANEYFNQAQNLWQSLNSPKVAEALFGKAWIAHKQKRNSEAIQLMDQAVAAFQKAGERQGELKTSAFKGFLYQVDGKTAESIASYEQTISAIESLRDSIKLADLKSTFTDKQIDLYQNLIELLWNTGQYEKAFNYVERAKARSFLDQIANARITPNKGATPAQLKKYRDLNDQIGFLQQQNATLKKQTTESFGEKEIALRKNLEAKEKELAARRADYDVLFRELQSQNPEFASLKSVKVPELAKIQKQLDPETTLVEYHVASEHTFAFAITRDSFKPVLLPNASQDNLIDRFNAFRDNNRKRTNDSGESSAVALQSALNDLHQWLIVPLKPYLKRKVVIVPHGILHSLPFAALTNGTRYLNEDHALSTLPSASILQFLQEKRKPKTNTILALGKPTITEPLSELRFAKPEVEAIAGLYKTIPLIGKDATEQAIWQRGGNAGILHIAAHGQYNPSSPLFSTIFLAGASQPTIDSHNDGRLEAREVYDLDLKATNLVVLSACETQKGKRSTGDEVVGLSRAFIYAGTPSIIATLWSVDDEASGLLMQKFYKHLKGGMEKAEALRQAQNEIRSNPKYRNPYYWAAFTLSGDGGK